MKVHCVTTHKTIIQTQVKAADYKLCEQYMCCTKDNITKNTSNYPTTIM